jgi:hypothetical protein
MPSAHSRRFQPRGSRVASAATGERRSTCRTTGRARGASLQDVRLAGESGRRRIASGGRRAAWCGSVGVRVEGAGGPTIDHRAVVDPSFLELVRLGIKRANTSRVVSSLPIVNRELGVDTPSGRFCHRYSTTGTARRSTAAPSPGAGQPRPAVADLRGRAWRVRAVGRRRGRGPHPPARDRRNRQRGLLLPEQVGDDKAPPGQEPGTGTFSATPLSWTHAQLVPARLVDRRRPPG